MINNKLNEALKDPIWGDHKIGNTYSMVNRDGSKSGLWKIAYYPLLGTYKGGVWEEFDEPRALIEQPIKEGGNDFREMPLRYLEKIQNDQKV